MKWLVGLGALVAFVTAMLVSRARKMGPTLDMAQEAERARLEVVRVVADAKKERAFAELEKTRSLSGPERLHLALLRARLRRANTSGG